MVRLSDILKKKMQAASEDKKKPEEAAAQEPKGKALPSGLSTQKEKPAEEKQIPEQEPKEMEIARAVKETQPDVERIRNLYIQMFQLTDELYNEVLINEQNGKPTELNPLVKTIIEDMVNYLILDSKTFFTLFYEDYPIEDYPYKHVVNVIVMSISLGLELGYNKSKLNELSLIALLHDLGMIKHREISLKPATLSKKEYNQIKEHPQESSKFISNINGISESIAKAVTKHHERVDGSGYPAGETNGETSELARIIGTVDVFEALTHTRAYRKRYLPYEAIKKIAKMGNKYFDLSILKILIQQIGIYPIGSWVFLNSNEIAKVITVNADYPLRPVVNIIYGLNRKALEKPRLINLSKEYNIYIKKPLADEEVSELVKE